MNSEPPTQAGDTHEKQGPAARLDPQLTLAAKKLAGSANCLNCNTELKGPFCYYCGQPDRNFLRFFPALLRDLMEDVLDYDSRFMRTLKPLIFKPGQLTKDFMTGRRFRYTPPMRLYIFSSIVFFLLAALLPTDFIAIGGTEEVRGEPGIIYFSGQTEGQRQQIQEALNGLPAEQRDKFVLDPEAADATESSDQTGVIHVSAASEDEVKQVEEVLNTLPADLQAKMVLDPVAGEATAAENEPMFSPNEITFTGNEPWNRETNPIAIPFVPQWLNDRLNDEVENSPKKARQIQDNPNLFVDKLLDILPAAMFVLLPIVALIFKFWYMFAKRFYVEHLILSLHNHAFIFVCLIALLLLNEAGDMLGSRELTSLNTVVDWSIAAIWIWIPVYLLVSLRVVYQQSWLMTVLKFMVISISYTTMLTVVTMAAAAASFILL